MFLKKLDLKNFRNYGDLSINFNCRGNLLFGKNGQGKTNLLESIYYLSLFRSFRKGTSSDLSFWGEGSFQINGLFETNNGLDRSLSVLWDKSKQVFYENSRVEKLSDVVGLFPTILLSPESIEITQGFPESRRRFLDICFSMVDAEYLSHLQSYKRLVKQRNSILTSDSYIDDVYLDSWNEELIVHGSFLIDYRKDAIKLFSDVCCDAYRIISGGSEELSVEYQSSIGEAENSHEQFVQELNRKRSEELRKKTTLVGPHRDELMLKLDGRDARKYGSQGQHKTILLALKAGEMQYIRDKKGVEPVILLDDLFALLDSKRIMSFMSILKNYNQFFITANMDIHPEELLSEAGFEQDCFSQFYVEGGVVQPRINE